MKVVAIVQARMGSTRFPNKVMKPINGIPMIELLLTRLSRSQAIDQIVLATSVDPRNQPLIEHVSQLGFACEQGSENDVLERFVQAAEKHDANIVVRISGDCPLVDPKLVDECVDYFLEGKLDYLINSVPPTYPDGLDVEVVSLSALQRANLESENSYDHEHVTPYIRAAGNFKTDCFQNDEDLSRFRWTVDEPQDLEAINNIFKHFAPEIHFGWKEVLNLQQKQPEMFEANKHKRCNQGMRSTMDSGQTLWQRAKG